uniref:Uncharacterized protein n=1 Tax=Globodera rostochiensis TaxID=31243 RepID=A0A914I4M8_GLORO
MHQNFFSYLLSILLLIAMIAYSVSVEVIEDGTPEAEDLAKALALSKRFFWRTMIEKWNCYEMTVKPNEIGVTDKDELRQICVSWKVKALATNAFLKSWEKHEGASSSSSSANIPNNQIKVEKPLFRVADGRELQLSSAIEAIKAAYRVLFGWRAAAEFNTEFDFVNLFKFLHKNGPIISPKESKLNQSESNGTRFLKYWDSVLELGLDMEMICKEVKNYANEHKDNPNALPISKEMIKERYVGKTFYIYKHLIRDPMLNKNLDLKLKPLQDPCEEAKLKVKKIEGSLSSG